MRFIDAPAVAGETFEIATDIKDATTAGLFRSKGWRLGVPTGSQTIRNYIGATCKAPAANSPQPKTNIVRLNTGWFSDRSACYLAAGRPVITQETGFTRLYGGEKGLFAFSDLDGVREAAAAITADYAKHSRAAYEIAQEFFEAEKVLGSLLERAGI